MATGDKLGNVEGCSVGVAVGAVGAAVAIVVGDSVGGMVGAASAVVNRTNVITMSCNFLRYIAERNQTTIEQTDTINHKIEPHNIT